MAGAKTPLNSDSAFEEWGFAKTIQGISDHVRELYLCDAIPWVIGYSGGKDSSAVLQLVWNAIRELPEDKRQKPIHVISTDTMVEQPLVAAWVDTSLGRLQNAAAKQKLPITPHKLTPEIQDSFWVNLIGRGYPAPRQKFRWCTERMKIRPSNKFIRDMVRRYGEAILVLGTRKAESQVRAARMEKLESTRVREGLSPNKSLPNSLVFTPIENWSNDDVWLYLMQVKNPWGHDNKSLLTMYQGASEGGECPLVVDTTTPSCGSSRFGCWVCTVVDKDRSMEAMIKNDEEKAWMMPLLELRNEMDKPDDRDRRDYRRMSGQIQLFHDRTIPGPYLKHWREHWLRRVLIAQESIRKNGPEDFSNISLISLDEMQEIRRIWLHEKHEFDDSLPRIYEEVTSKPFPKKADDGNWLRQDDWELLREICGDDSAYFDLQVSLLGVERRFRAMTRRSGVFEALEDRFRAGMFVNEQEAIAVLSGQRDRRDEITGEKADSPVETQRQLFNEPASQSGSDAE
jgi:DNA sulfur modification protein DndC